MSLWCHMIDIWPNKRGNKNKNTSYNNKRAAETQIRPAKCISVKEFVFFSFLDLLTLFHKVWGQARVRYTKTKLRLQALKIQHPTLPVLRLNSICCVPCIKKLYNISVSDF